MNSVLQFIAILALSLEVSIACGAIIGNSPIHPMLMAFVQQHPWLDSGPALWTAILLTVACAIYLARET